MKFQLDTKEKVIKIEERVNLEELFEVLKKILPNGEWKQFDLECNTTIVWSNPITVPIYPYYPANPYPWWDRNPIITYGSPLYNGANTAPQYTLTEGVYNIQTS